MPLLAAVIVFMAPSCKSTRKVIKAPLKTEGEQYLLTKMGEAETKYKYFTAKCNIIITNTDKSKSEFGGQLRILKDSLIWLSLSPALGIEVVRMKITPDSIQFINRLDKTFFEGDYAFVYNKFATKLNFDILQALITGNDLTLYDNSNFHGSVDGKEYRLSTTNRLGKKKNMHHEDALSILVQNIWLSPEHFKIVRIALKEVESEESKRLQVAYKSFTEISGQYIPNEIQFALQGENKMEMKVQYSRIEIDQPQSFPFKIPENYTKLK